MNDSALIEYLHTAIPGLIAVYRFGSEAKGTAGPHSDIDLALLARHPLANLHRFELAQALAVHLHRDIDLVDLRAASTVMRMQVLSTGICLATFDDQARRTFEMYSYADYARLNEVRRVIVRGITARGLVYG